jgi:hypothetical protein
MLDEALELITYSEFSLATRRRDVAFLLRAKRRVGGGGVVSERRY